ncbi:Transcriptional regulator, contains HTH domain [Halalkaliarchaeum sp. AArc-CO]|uniref:helix-turn-helix domain-containing protein n=1 Tax=unclassified Halalkaliarchaeum TaxID=2678344 RepID=UPI00217E594D|nr:MULTISPECIES: helix-turn-helix domain-containing protein [unclassified Halalkaliarchaeum]MDR5671554.1 helix-turn-helix domain-containing protein [Halalkaliarchaeum sp. AArc-GB]UWG51054.1 Transcriptional regulator, contains HTH domain [Halalkaliarchaeum sp. AArc-CO]
MSGNATSDGDVIEKRNEGAGNGEILAREFSEDDRVLISFSVPEPDDVITILNCGQKNDLDIQNVGVIDPSSSDTCPVHVDIGLLTQTQWETLELAFAMDYYQNPRGTSLEELATELGISKSAVSQRLNGAERKLVQAMFQSIPLDHTTEQ